MPNLVECLRSFNRKERYWVIRNALGECAKRLSPEFLQLLEDEVGVSIERDAWWAVDYDINWFIAALLLYNGVTRGENVEIGGGKLAIQGGNPQDFDLVVAFNATVILIEAKGVTSWSNEQMRNKRDRLAALDAFSDKFGKKVDLFLVTMSPSEPKKLNELIWSEKIKIGRAIKETFQRYHVQLEIEDRDNFKVVTRCNEKYEPFKDGKHFRITPEDDQTRK